MRFTASFWQHWWVFGRRQERHHGTEPTWSNSGDCEGLQPSGYDASKVELVEAHGTSTKVGDATELSTLSRLWTGVEGAGNRRSGSIKSQIGHLKAAAGIAGIMKSVMALHHRTIRPAQILRRQIPRWTGQTSPSLSPRHRLVAPPILTPAGQALVGVWLQCFRISTSLEGYEPDYHAPIAAEWDTRWTAYSGQGPVSAPSIFDGSLPATMTHDEIKAVEGQSLAAVGFFLEALHDAVQAVSFEGPLFDEDAVGSVCPPHFKPPVRRLTPKHPSAWR